MEDSTTTATVPGGTGVAPRHEDTPPPGPAPRQPASRVTYYTLAAKKGVFEFRKGKDQPFEAVDWLAGKLVSWHLTWDEGRPDADAKKSIPARWEWSIVLNRPNESAAIVQISPEAALYVAGSQLVQCSVGEWISMRLIAGDDSCLTEVAVWTLGEWEWKFTPKSDGSPLTDRYNAVIEQIRRHPAYKEPERKIDERERVVDPDTGETLEVKDARSTAVGVGSNARAGSGAPNGSAANQRIEENRAAVAAQAPGSGLFAFGYEASKAPPQESWENTPTDLQPAKLLEFAEQRKITAHSSDILRVLLDAFKIDPSVQNSRGAYALAIDFLRNAKESSIAELRSKLAGDEYDPFADE